MLRRSLSWVLALALVLSAMPAQAWASESADPEQSAAVLSETATEATNTESALQTVPETTEETVPVTTEEIVPVTTEETVPETTEETVPETTEETVPETTEETVPETTEETVPETTEETVPETTEETVPETTEETVPETTAETVAPEDESDALQSLDTEVLVEGETITVNYGGQWQKTLTFTPQQSGVYAIWKVDSADTILEIRGTDVNYTGKNAVQGYLEAGVSYSVVLTPAGEFTQEVSVRAETVTTATGIHFLQTECSGYSGETIFNFLEYEPGNGEYQQITYTSSDTEVVEVLGGWTESVTLKLKKVGSATLTATSENGLTASCTVTVEGTQTWEQGQIKQLSLASGETVAYNFTAPQDGKYILWEEESHLLVMEVYRATGDFLSQTQGFVQFEATAGESYLIKIENINSQTTQSLIQLDQAVPTQSISLIESQPIEGFSGETQYANLQHFPANAWRAEKTWESSDPNVAEPMYTSAEMCGIQLKQPGTATITATGSDGIEISFTITSRSTSSTMELDVPVHFTLGGSTEAFSFTAQESGRYNVTEASQDFSQPMPNIEILEESGRWLCGGWHELQFEAVAGETYIVKFISSTDQSIEYEYCMTKATATEGITLEPMSSVMGYSGASYYLPVEYLPAGACQEPVTWTVADPEIVTIYGQDYSCRIVLGNPGTTTVTATTQSGFSASCEVTVMESKPFPQEGQGVFQIPGYSFVGYYYVAPESGYRKLWDSNENGSFIEVISDTGDMIASGNDLVEFYMEQGRQYLFQFYSQVNEEREYCYCIAQQVNVSDISLSANDLTAWTGETIRLDLVYKPGFAPLENVTWTIEGNDGIVEQTDCGNDFILLQTLQPGVVTVTAQTDSGLQASCQITVNDEIVMELDTPYEVAIPWYYDQSEAEPVVLSFTAPEDGNYTIWNEAESYGGIEVRDAEGVLLNSNPNVVSFDAVAGQTYFFHCYNGNGYDTLFCFRVAQSIAPESIRLNFHEIKRTVGMSCYLQIEVEPAHAQQDAITWTVDRPDLASISSWTDTCSVTCLAAGTVTVTASAGDVSDSCTITILEPEEINPGFDRTMTAAEGDSVGYFFTPEENGNYTFWYDAEGLPLISVQEYVPGVNTPSIASGGGKVQFDAQAGVKYRISVNEMWEGEYRLHLEKTVPAETLSLSQQSLIGYPGEHQSVTWSAEPINAGVDELICSIEDETVAQIVYQVTDRISIDLLAPGETTLTVSLGDLTASCRIKVKEREEIYVGDVKEAALEASESASYLFTPTESATHVFWNEYATDGVDLSLYLAEGNQYVTATDSGRLAVYLEAGQNYLLNARNLARSQITVKLHLQKGVAATGFDLGETMYMYTGWISVLSATPTPINGVLGELEWVSEDPNVAKIEEPYAGGNDSKLVVATGVGQTTITVREPATGFEDSVQIVVREIPSLPLNTAVTIQQTDQDGLSVYQFTPPQDGIYTLTLTEGGRVWVGCIDKESNTLLQEAILEGAANQIQLDLDGGVSYIIDMSLRDEQGVPVSGSYTVYLSSEEEEQPLTITTQPVDHVGAVGSTAEFTVAVNKENVTYQWYYSNDGQSWAKSGASGATTDTLTIQMTAARQGQLYRCEITDDAGTVVVSNAVSMRLPESTIEIQTQPVDYAGAEWDMPALTVEATGEGLRYRWYYSSTGGETWALSYSEGYDTATLKPVLRAYNSGRMFKCQITDVNGNTQWTNAVTMVLDSGEISIVSQPVSYEGALDDLAEFTVAAQGVNLTYQWYFSQDAGKTWNMSYNEGYNTPTLKVRLYAYRSGYQYKCVIYSGNTVCQESVVVTLSKKAETVTIVQNPLNTGGAIGSIAYFQVIAEGEGLRYQWQFSKDGGLTWADSYMTGATTDTLPVDVLSYRDGWQYRCKVTDDSGSSRTTTAAVLRVGNVPVITQQPEDYVGPANETVCFSVAASGDNLTYQWQYSNDGGTVWVNSGASGATTASLEVVAYAYRNGQKYRCIVTNEFGSVISEAVSVTIG